MRLVTVAHGTRTPAGNEIARQVTDAAEAALGVPALCSFVELSAPLFADVMRFTHRPAVAVPLLLSTGFHIRHDLPEALALAGGPVALAGALGPHPLLAEAAAGRLREAGVEPGRPVLLVAAGSNDPDAATDLDRAAEHLAAVWGAPVTVAVLGGAGSRLEDVATPDHAVSPYLLAPGFFARRLRTASAALGLPCADVLGAHTRVVDLVVERFVTHAARLAA